MSNKHFPIPLAKGIQKKIPREQWGNHPEYQGKIQKLLGTCVFPKDEIPKDFHYWLLQAMLQFSLPTLGIPQSIYFKFVNTPPDTYKFGELQKALDIVFNSKPCFHNCDNNSLIFATEILNAYHSQMGAVMRMKQTFEDIISPLKEQVIDELILQDAPSIIK